LKVLSTAARYGSVYLANEAWNLLEKRSNPNGGNHKFSESSYANRLAAFARASDLPSAFQVLSQMQQNGTPPTTTTANAIEEVLLANNDIADVDSAYFVLKDLHDEQHATIHVEALNIILRACVKLGDLSRALGLYRDCSSLSIDPTTNTFNILFEGCNSTTFPPAVEIAMFLAEEMKEMGIKAEVSTFEELLKCNLYQDNYDSAFMYLESLKASFGKPRGVVYEWMATRLFEMSDPRLEILLEDMEQIGYALQAQNLKEQFTQIMLEQQQEQEQEQGQDQVNQGEEQYEGEQQAFAEQPYQGEQQLEGEQQYEAQQQYEGEQENQEAQYQAQEQGEQAYEQEGQQQQQQYNEGHNQSQSESQLPSQSELEQPERRN